MKALKVQSQETQKTKKSSELLACGSIKMRTDSVFKSQGLFKGVWHVDSSCPDHSGRREQLGEDLGVRKQFLLNTKLGLRLYSELEGEWNN